MNATRKSRPFVRNDHDTEPTERQRAIFDFIVCHALENLYQPSIREIAIHFGINSANGVHCHIKALQERGWIDFSNAQSRAIRILRKPTITADYSHLGESEVAR